MKKLATLSFTLIILFSTTPVFCASITNVNFTPTTPATLDFLDFVHLDFEYSVDVDSYIFARPMFEGTLRTDYGSSGSTVYYGGTSGTSSSRFTIFDIGQEVAYVDAIRFQFTDLDQTNILFEHFEPVDFTFGTPVTPVPEPSTFLLLGGGLVGLALAVRRKKKE